MKYNFDEVIDRKGTNALNTDGFREYLFGAGANTELPYKDDDFIRMWVADMEFATPPEVIDAVKDRLDKKIFGYTKVFDPEYYNVFSKWTQDYYGWSFKREDLVHSDGIVPALYSLVEYICRPGDKVLIMTPSYASFKRSVDANKTELVCSHLIEEGGNYTIDFEDLEAKAKDPRMKLLIFCNPHNPTGRVWTEEELKRVGEICLANDVFIISDEIHCDLLRSGLNHTPLAKLFPETDRIITCMAPSKTFNMAGLMFSNIIIPNDEIMKIWKSRFHSFFNPLSITASQAAYEHCHNWLEELKIYLDDNFKFTKLFLDEHLPRAVFNIPESTYLAWIDVSAYIEKDTNLTLYFAKNAGVLLEGGDMFVSNADGFIRLNIACPRSILKEGLDRIIKLLNN